MSNKIDINQIFIDSILNNKLVIIPSITYLVGHYLQDIVFTRSVASVTADVPGFIDNIDILSLFYFLLPYLISLILLYFSDILASKTLPRIELDALYSLTNQVIESSKTTKTTPNISELMLHIKKLSDTKRLYDMIFMYIFPTLFVMGILIYNVSRANIQIGMLVILTVLLLLAITITIEYDIMNNVVETEKVNDEVYEDIHDVMDNLDTVLTTNMKDAELEKIANKTDEIFKYIYEADTIKYNGTYEVLILTLIAVLVINYFSYSLYKSGSITTVTLVSNVLLSVLFMDYYGYSITALMDIMKDIGRINEISQFFANFKLEEENPNKKNLIISKADIEFKNINLQYDDKVIFSNMNIAIKGGQIVGIVGPIGTGKSTILKMLSGIVDYEGEILVDGQNIKEYSYESITNSIAYISQHPKLFDRTILENITYGTKYTETDVMKITKQLGLESFFDQFPQKLLTPVGKGGTALSGGQKQFVALIRATLQNKKVLLMDEPTSSLDIQSKKQLIEILKKLKGKTILIVTHDKDLDKIFDEIIKLTRKNNVMVRH